MEKNMAIQILAVEIRKRIQKSAINLEQLEEIRLRIGQPVWLLYQQRPYYLGEDGKLQKTGEHSYTTTFFDMKETLEYASGCSMYAYENERRQGFMTIQGGHRIGLAGKVVVEQGKVKNISDIGMINIRIAHQCLGCSEKVLPYLKEHKQLQNTLILSPPGGGKTTLLRDLIRALASEKEGYTVGVVDERSELAASYRGVPQNDLGTTVDVLDGCPKAQGIWMLLRSMAPDVIVVDEIGEGEDVEAIRQANNNGCRLLASMHGNDMEKLRQRSLLRQLMEEKIFRRFVVLDDRFHAGSVKGIYREDGCMRV